MKTLQHFLLAWWTRAGWDAMLAPVELPTRAGVSPQVIEEPSDLAAVNPFAPVMLSNTASFVNEFVRDRPRKRLAILLRPCELRTLVEMHKRNRVLPEFPAPGREIGDVTIVGVDCLGTLSKAEYINRISLRSAKDVVREALTYDVEDGALPNQLRAVCQVCDWPAPRGGDVVIGFIGAAQQGYLLIIARDEPTDERLGLPSATDGEATATQVLYRQTVIETVSDRRKARWAGLINAGSQPSGDLCSLLACFARCTLCADCLDACPLYEGELTGLLGVGGIHERGHPLMSELVSVSRWLTSCSGCGMCQEACEYGISLAPPILALSYRIREGLHYTVGDPAQPLPWVTA